jgi:hypothetical protein
MYCAGWLRVAVAGGKCDLCIQNRINMETRPLKPARCVAGQTPEHLGNAVRFRRCTRWPAFKKELLIRFRLGHGDGC